MRIKAVRRTYTLSHKRLNRARQLYARLLMAKWYSLEPGEDRDRWMNYVAAAALHRGLWAVTGPKRQSGAFGNGQLNNIRYSLCSRWRRMTPGYDDPMGWYRWIRDNHSCIHGHFGLTDHVTLRESKAG